MILIWLMLISKSHATWTNTQIENFNKDCSVTFEKDYTKALGPSNSTNASGISNEVTEICSCLFDVGNILLPKYSEELWREVTTGPALESFAACKPYYLPNRSSVK